MLDKEREISIFQLSELELFEQQLHVVQEALELNSIELSREKKVNDELTRKHDALLLENTLLFNQLCVVQKNLVDHISLNKSLSSSLNTRKGASDIKKHLSYRLGNILVLNGKSIIGLVKMPWLLFKEVRNFRSDRNKLNKK